MRLRLVIRERFIRDAAVANDSYADMFVKFPLSEAEMLADPDAAARALAELVDTEFDRAGLFEQEVTHG